MNIRAQLRLRNTTIKFAWSNSEECLPPLPPPRFIEVWRYGVPRLFAAFSRKAVGYRHCWFGGRVQWTLLAPQS